MKKLEETMIPQLIVKNADKKNFLIHEQFANLLSTILFKGTAAYLVSLNVDKAVLQLNAPVYYNGKYFHSELLNVYLFHDSKGNRKIHFDSCNHHNFEEVSGTFDDENDKIIYFEKDKEALKFLSEFSMLNGIEFVGDVEQVLDIFACIIYAIEDYLIANFDKNDDNCIEIPGVVKVKMNNIKCDKEKVNIVDYVTLFNFEEIDEIVKNVKESLEKDKK